jgi:hypothetical protein
MKYTEDKKAAPLEISNEDDEEVKDDGNDDFNDERNENDDSISIMSNKKKRKLKTTAKENIKAYNEEVGHQAHNEDDIKRVNKSKTLRAVKDLCKKYLCEENKPTFTFVCDADMYISYTAMNLEAKKQF